LLPAHLGLAFGVLGEAFSASLSAAIWNGWILLLQPGLSFGSLADAFIGYSVEIQVTQVNLPNSITIELWRSADE
jgi:hypothetical protein